jgi:hypothetical protein
MFRTVEIYMYTQIGPFYHTLRAVVVAVLLVVIVVVVELMCCR